MVLIPLRKRNIGEEAMLKIRRLVPLAMLAAVLGHGAPSPAQTIIDEWSSVKAPPPPELKAATVDPKTTALLVMDLVKPLCNAERRPRCVASLPKIAGLIAAARAADAMVVYTTVPNVPISDTVPAVAPKGNEPTFT